MYNRPEVQKWGMTLWLDLLMTRWPKAFFPEEKHGLAVDRKKRLPCDLMTWPDLLTWWPDYLTSLIDLVTWWPDLTYWLGGLMTWPDLPCDDLMTLPELFTWWLDLTYWPGDLMTCWSDWKHGIEETWLISNGLMTLTWWKAWHCSKPRRGRRGQSGGPRTGSQGTPSRA